MKRLFPFAAVLFGLMLTTISPAAAQAPPVPDEIGEQMVTMDFNQVDLPTFIKFVSELTRQNFAIDDRVKGKVTIYAPKKIPVSAVYSVFEQVLELKGFGLVPSDNVVQVLPLSDMPPVRDIHVYYLQNADAEEMAKVLTGIVSRSTQSAARPRGAIRSGREFEGVVQILADPPTNAMIITASPRDYNMIRTVLEKLDIKRRQVYVEAVLLEVTIGAGSQFGVDVFGMEDLESGRYTGFGGSLTGVGAGGLLTETELASAVSGLSGLSFGAVQQFTIGGTDFFSVGALVQAVASDANINVLSTPQILTSDNQKAEIIVGDNVPILTSQSQTTGGNFQTQVERKDIGITLRLTPQILESELVKLDVFQEISNIRTDVDTSLVQSQGVITSKKSATTTVIVQDKQTVVIGGLISDSVTDTVKKVPLLGDIPLLGWLFKKRIKDTTKTNLLMFLTPHVIKGPADLFALQQQKSREMMGFIEDQRIGRKASRLQFLEQAINAPE
ncbi:MAG: secretin N-terminal domain-containing protein [Leptospirillia bacterium]